MFDKICCHLDDALNGRGSYGKAWVLSQPPRAKKCFAIMNSVIYRRFFFLPIVAYSSLAFWEPTQRDTEINFQAASVSLAVVIATLLILTVFTVDSALHIQFYSWKIYWAAKETKWLKLQLCLLVLFLVDYAVLLLQRFTQMRMVIPFRCLRAMMFVCKSKSLQHVAAVCLSTAVKLGKVFLVLFVFIAIFSAVGVHLFIISYHNIGHNGTEINCLENSSNPYTGTFDHVGKAALQLFVLLTTENYPEIMMPSFNQSQFSFLFFGSFLYIGGFFLTTIMLAIVVDSYWIFAKMKVKEERKKEREEMIRAWNILDNEAKGKLSVTDQRFFEILKHFKPKCSDNNLRELLAYVDVDDDGFINTFEWTTRLVDVLRYKFEEEVKPFHYHWERPTLMRISNSEVFCWCLLSALSLHSVLFCVHWCGMTETETLIVHSIRMLLNVLFLGECGLRFAASAQVLQQKWYLVDFALTITSFLTSAFWFLPTSLLQTLLLRSALDIIAGLAIISRFAIHSKQIQTALTMFFKVIPVMIDLIILVFIIMYFYAAIGLEVFYQDNISETMPLKFDYYKCGLGFQSFKCSLLTVFQIASSSNWHELMNAARMVTTEAAALYFVCCYVTIVLIFMNLFVAIAIQAFDKIAERDVDVPNNEASATKKLSNLKESAKSFFKDLFSSPKVEQSTPRRASIALLNNDRRLSSAHIIQEEKSIPEGEEDESLANQVSEGEGHTSNLNGAMMKDDEPQHLVTTTPVSTDKASDTLNESRLEQKLKDRRRQRNLKPSTIMKAVIAYRKKTDSEIDLHVGDEVIVLQRAGDMVKGQTDRNRTGWFPASCIHEIIRGGSKPRDSPSSSDGNSRRLSMQNVVLMASSQLNKSTSGTGTKPYADDKNHTRIAAQRTGEWHRKILGDITVMNHEEMVELNRLLLQQRSKSPSYYSVQKSPPSEEQCQPSISATVHGTPQIKVEQFPEQLDDIEEEAEVAVTNSPRDSLTVESVTRKRVTGKRKIGSQEMPDWAKRFMEKNQSSPSDLPFLETMTEPTS